MLRLLSLHCSLQIPAEGTEQFSRWLNTLLNQSHTPYGWGNNLGNGYDKHKAVGFWEVRCPRATCGR